MQDPLTGSARKGKASRRSNARERRRSAWPSSKTKKVIINPARVPFDRCCISGVPFHHHVFGIQEMRLMLMLNIFFTIKRNAFPSKDVHFSLDPFQNRSLFIPFSYLTYSKWLLRSSRHYRHIFILFNCALKAIESLWSRQNKASLIFYRYVYVLSCKPYHKIFPVERKGTWR